MARDRGDRSTARDLFAEALVLDRRRVGLFGENPSTLHDVVVACGRLARVEQHLGRLDVAGEHLFAALSAARSEFQQTGFALRQSVDDLRKVKGIGDKTLEKLRPLVAVKPAFDAK